MKLIFVLRHSKAEKNFFGSDFDRALTQKGIENTTLVANKLKDFQIDFDLVIASTAKRVVETAAELMNCLHIEADKIKYSNNLYHAPESEYFNQLVALDNTINKVLLVGHNPGITYFVNAIGVARIDNMPTTGLFGFSVDCDNWIDFKKSKKEFLYFDQPKPF